MQLCNKVNEFMENDPPPDFEKIPVSLAEHIVTCHECQKLVSFFQSLTKDKKIQHLSEKEVGEFMKVFQKRALAVSKKNNSEVHPKKSINSFFSFKFGFAFAVVILLLMFGFSFLFRQPSAIKTNKALEFATIKGNATIVSSENIAKTDSQDFLQALSTEERIAFDSKATNVEVAYKNGGKVFLTGIGRMKVLKDGLNVEHGKFNAKFKNLQGIMKVRVPCAILAIRGTEIKFNIQRSSSEISLIEGAADLIPNDSSVKPIRLETGKRVSLKNNTWVCLLSPKKQVPVEKSVEKNTKKPTKVVIENKAKNIANTDSSPVEEIVNLDSETEEIDEEVSEAKDITGREGFDF